MTTINAYAEPGSTRYVYASAADFATQYEPYGFVLVGPAYEDLPDDAGAYDDGPLYRISHTDGRTAAVTYLNYVNYYEALGWTIGDLETPPVLSTPTLWYTELGATVAAHSSQVAKITVLSDGCRGRPNPADQTQYLYDYPVTSTHYELAIGDSRTGTRLIEVTLDREELEHYSNGNGCWSPDGAWIIFQSQIGLNEYITYGREPGYGALCDFYCYRVSDGEIFRLTTTAISGTGVTVAPWRFQPIFYSNTGVIYTERYADDPATNGDGRWRLRSATFTASDPPTLTSDAVFLNPYVQLWGYYIVPMGFFPNSHPNTAWRNKFLVAGNLDETFSGGVAQGTQPGSKMKNYAVTGGVSPTKTAAILPLHADAWEEGVAIDPASGDLLTASNRDNGGGLDEETWREFQIKAADGLSSVELTGFNVTGSYDDCGAVLVRAVAQHSQWFLDGNAFLGAIVTQTPGGPVGVRRVLRVDLT